MFYKKLTGGEIIAKSKDKKEYFLSARIKSEKPKEDWGAFVKAMKEKGWHTSGSLLERAAYELMERECWDPETQQFIDFDDDDDDVLKLKPKHTHIDQKSVEQSVELAEERESEVQEIEETHVNDMENSEEEAIRANADNDEKAKFIKVKINPNEALFTFAFCKLCGNMNEVHYEQIEQLSLPFFKTKDNRAVVNKTNILIGNQCVVRKLNDNKWFKVLRSGTQKFTAENMHLNEILEKEISLDFLEALKP